MTKKDEALQAIARLKQYCEDVWPHPDNLMREDVRVIQAALTEPEQISLPDENVGLPYGIVDPDYARIYTKVRCISWMYGYATLMQGSFTRDLDLLVIPWAENICTNPQHIIDMICSKCGLHENGHPPTQKPHGRIAYTLLFKEFGDPRFIDVGFMPSAPKLPKD